MLKQIIYSSKAATPMRSDDLARILDDARRGNAARDVTGVLIHAEGVFVQVLEGEGEALAPLLDSIRADSRHRDMKVFRDEPVERRAFHDWRMAWLAPDVAEMARWAGLEGTDSIEGVLETLHRNPQQVPRVLVHIVEAIAAAPADG